MFKFISTPNLPKTDIHTCIISRDVSYKVIHSLNKNGINTVFSAKLNNVMKPVSLHSDLSICHIQDNIFVCEPTSYDYYKKVLPSVCELIQGSSLLSSNYPSDIAYNIARINELAFHNLKFTDKIICEYFEKFGVKLVHVNQGYSKCNVCIVSNQAIITSDIGIAKKADNFNIDVLFIENRGIALPGFDYGFLGGASGLISPCKLAVTGDISHHKDYERICSFCFKYNVEVCALSDGNAIDVGSIIPILEKRDVEMCGRD